MIVPHIAGDKNGDVMPGSGNLLIPHQGHRTDDRTAQLIAQDVLQSIAKLALGRGGFGCYLFLGLGGVLSMRLEISSVCGNGEGRSYPSAKSNP